ncbi:hypothetical protein DPMN_038644 [Dreissena polymorpha]|uniref:EGF-like domain-containing protein n=1 Tax=Dreissena polymorpha TaxID=45954 RepID=A0A9D4MFU0_DREPO|nr:hypothetical protein DPMN_038644 [Dreissena polymorpha]
MSVSMVTSVPRPAQGVATAQEAHVSDTRRGAKGVSAAVMATTVREHAQTVLVASVIRLSVFAKAHAWTAISGKSVTPVAAIDARAVRSLLERVWFAMSELTELIVNSIAVTSIISCNKVNGYCDSGACVPGFYRPTCTSSCSSNCKDVVCELQSGNCTNGCNVGWFGRVCDGTCSANCLNRNCLGSADNCLEGCVPEMYGPQCNIPCNSNCSTGVCNITGYCTRGCLPGWYGDMCDRMCNATCMDGRCSRTLGTNPSPLCRTSACPAGLTGTFCNVSCSSSFCAENKCGRYTGTCIGCLVGRYGDQCERQCDTCLAGTKFQQVDGRCDDECMPGYYGSFCRQSCTTCITCTKSTGLCTTCTRGQYGELCQYNCRSIISCNIVTADCASRQCTAGYWDTDCFSFCNPNCGRSNTTGLVSCDFLTGRCSSECVSGWYGSHCDRKCESLCYDGSCDRNQGVCVECLKPNPDFNCPSGQLSDPLLQELLCQLQGRANCTDTNCKSSGQCNECAAGEWALSCSADCGRCSPEAFGIVRCDINTGICSTDSCVPGYHGNRCQNTCGFTCKDSTSGVNECNRNTGICTNGCDIGYYDVYCDKNCSDRCRNRDCATTANDCRQECAYGYYGNGYYAGGCNTPCLFANCDTCNKDSGQCSTCKTGFYGTRCDLSCSPNCAANINGVISCSKDLGLCDEQRCRPGYWDTTCTIQCSATCLRDSAGNRICQFSNGTCIVGCEDTYFGSECDSAGCVTGRYGDRCEFSCLDTCNDNTCGRTSGVCDECNKLPQLQSALCRTAGKSPSV